MQKETTTSMLAGLPPVINAANKHLFPSIFQEGFEVMERYNGKIIFPEKYLLSLKSNAKAKLTTLAKTNPELSPKEALMNVLTDVPNTVPTDMLAKVAKYALMEWEKLTMGQKQLAFA